MQAQTIIFILLSIGFLLLFKINPFTGLIRLIARPKEDNTRERRMTAAEFVRKLEGKNRDNLVQRSIRETHNSLVKIGQAGRYKRVTRFALVTGVAAAVISFFLFRSPLLSLLIGLGSGLIPLWITSLSVYSHTKMVNRELETALSMITISYVRHSDIVKAVSETLPHTAVPVRDVLQRFVGVVKNIDGDLESAILRMKDELDSTLFHQWCDILILCQNDHTLTAGLMPVVQKLSELKIQQEENETLMMTPLRQIVVMIGLVISVLPILYLINQDWYGYLAHTLQGHVSIAFTAIIIFNSVSKAIKLAKPIDFKI